MKTKPSPHYVRPRSHFGTEFANIEENNNDMERVYLINIDDVNDYILANGLDEEEMMQVIMSMDEATCKEIVESSKDQYSEVFTLEEFESEFNYDTDNVFNSTRYFIRMF